MRRRWMLLAEVVLLVGLTVLAVFLLIDRNHRPADSIDLKVQLKGARDKVYLYRESAGEHRYQVRMTDGTVQQFTPDQFARRVYEDQHSRFLLAVLLNVATPAGLVWVGVGFLGQVLFTGRMVVQWLVSEKEKRSVVPPIFWWMSLVGATMLLMYFLWRKDPVGVLGQGFGWFIYVRNLYLIYAHKAAQAAVTEDPAPEPELNR